MGDEVLSLPLSCGGKLIVTSHAASEQDAPPEFPEGSVQEWRTLRFRPAPDAGSPGPPFIQSVNKVTVPAHSLQGAVADPRVLALAYSKSLVAALVTSLRALGAAASPRILVIGLGAGSVPLWLAQHLPGCSIDVVELDATVVRAACEAMGFKSSAAVRVVTGDGADFVAKAAQGGEAVYDAIVIDAYDSLDNVPDALTSADGPLAEALPSILDPSHGVLAANLPPNFPVADMLGGFKSVLAGAGQPAGPAFFVKVPIFSNSIAVLWRGGVPSIRDGTAVWGAMQSEGAALAREIRCPFDVAALASYNLEMV